MDGGKYVSNFNQFPQSREAVQKTRDIFLWEQSKDARDAAPSQHFIMNPCGSTAATMTANLLRRNEGSQANLAKGEDVLITYILPFLYTVCMLILGHYCCSEPAEGVYHAAHLSLCLQTPFYAHLQVSYHNMNSLGGISMTLKHVCQGELPCLRPE